MTPKLRPQFLIHLHRLNYKQAEDSVKKWYLLKRNMQLNQT